MYLAVVLLTMFVLPVGSVLAEHAMGAGDAVMWLVGRWFVFWAVGVRLMLAGVRQYLQPGFTAREIFHMQSSEAEVVVRELGVSNAAIGLLGLVSLAVPGFVLPVALYAAIFYGVAGIRHALERGRSRNETIAMVSDLFAALVLAAFAVWAIQAGALWR
jgi:hypothetical protein